MTMSAMFERRIDFTTARHVLSYLLSALGVWGATWLLLALVRPADTGPPLRPFFLAMLPVLLAIHFGPMWAFGGALVVNAGRDRLSVRRDRLFRRGVPVEVELGGARPIFTATRASTRRPKPGVLWVNVGGRSVRLADTARFEVLNALAVDLDAYYAQATRPGSA